MWLALLPSALAGDLYVNGKAVDPRQLTDVKLEHATVWFDTQGSIHVDAPGYAVEVVALPAVVSQAGRPEPASAPAGAVTPARWWLVTDDGGTAGHTIEVWINGQLVQTVRSGDVQRILDAGRWLHPGDNQVEIRSSSVKPAGGSLYVYLGTGSDKSGTVVMDEPAVQFGVGRDREGPTTRTYTLHVDR